ncbi:hypothetical protein EP7_000547 [Isosphaeraceae bacterium EP7]
MPLILWLAASAVACFVINSQVWPEYEAFTLIQVSPSWPNPFSAQQSTDTLRRAQFLRDQVALISSPFVLSNAALKPRIAAIPEIRDSASPPDLLKSKLTVVNIPETTLIRVSYLSWSPSESQQIVAGIVDEYLRFVVLRSESSQMKLRSNLEKFAQEFERELQEDRKELLELLHDVKEAGVVPADKDSPSSFTFLTKELHRSAAERLIQVDIELAEGSSKTEELKRARAYLRTLLSRPIREVDQVKVDFLTKEIESKSRELESIRRKIQELEFGSQSEARILKVDDTPLPGLPISDRRVPLMALASFGILCLVLAIRRIGLVPALLPRGGNESAG